jgi:hypothetical protein
MAFVMQKSVHGRKLAVSSSGGIVSAVGATGNDSATIGGAAQMWGSNFLETVSSAGTSLMNCGVSVISSDSTSGASFSLGTPEAGLYKEIHLQTAATALTLAAPSSTVYINSSLATAAAGGSTSVALAGATLGGSIALRGLSATVWGIVSNTAGFSS